MRRAGFRRETTEKLIRKAAVKTIAEYGFKAASLRKVAEEVGIQAGSLYNYITSKDDFLFKLLKEHLELMLADFERQAAEFDDVVEKLRKFIELHMLFHTEQKEEVIIGNLELRSLPPKNRKIVTALRDRYSNILTDLIRQGVKEERFSVEDPRVATFAIISLMSGVCYWYRDNGRLSRAELTRLHTRMVFQLLGVEDVPAKPVNVARRGARKKAQSPERIGSARTPA